MGIERVLLVAIVFAFFAAGMVVLTTCSRIVFAMSHDARFPAHRLMRRVDPRTHRPVPATSRIVVVGADLTLVLPGAALLTDHGVHFLPALIYGSTVVLYLAVRGRLVRNEGAFDLGRLELPVAIGALPHPRSVPAVVGQRVHLRDTAPVPPG
jgi:amino acid transporter